MKSLQRPKSAVLLSLPYNFHTKQEAVDIKQKVKKSMLITCQSESSLDNIFFSDGRKLSCRSYVDNGPSLLNISSQHYSLTQNGKSTIRSFKNSRAQSAVSVKRNSKQTLTGLENYKRLKPCKTISAKSLNNLQDFLQDVRKQSNFIDRIFENLSPRNQLIKKPQCGSMKKFIKKQKENELQISGKNNVSVFQEPRVKANFLQDIPYKANSFQPTLQRKSLQLFKRSKAYLMARG